MSGDEQRPVVYGLLALVGTWTFVALALLLAGTNNLNQGLDVASAPARLAALVDTILGSDPNVHVLVADIPVSSKTDLNTLITSFDESLAVITLTRPRTSLVDTSDITLADKKRPAAP